MSKIHVSAVVNGDPVDFLADPRESLLDCLRDQLGLTGSKEGCGPQEDGGGPCGRARRGAGSQAGPQEQGDTQGQIGPQGQGG